MARRIKDNEELDREVMWRSRVSSAEAAPPLRTRAEVMREKEKEAHRPPVGGDSVEPLWALAERLNLGVAIGLRSGAATRLLAVTWSRWVKGSLTGRTGIFVRSFAEAARVIERYESVFDAQGSEAAGRTLIEYMSEATRVSKAIREEGLADPGPAPGSSRRPRKL